MSCDFSEPCDVSPQISWGTPQFFGLSQKHPNFLGLKMSFYPKYVGVTPDLPQISGVTPDLPQITPDFLGQPQDTQKNWVEMRGFWEKK